MSDPTSLDWANLIAEIAGGIIVPTILGITGIVFGVLSFCCGFFCTCVGCGFSLYLFLNEKGERSRDIFTVRAESNYSLRKTIVSFVENHFRKKALLFHNVYMMNSYKIRCNQDVGSNNSILTPVEDDEDVMYFKDGKMCTCKSKDAYTTPPQEPVWRSMTKQVDSMQEEQVRRIFNTIMTSYRNLYELFIKKENDLDVYVTCDWKYLKVETRNYYEKFRFNFKKIVTEEENENGSDAISESGSESEENEGEESEDLESGDSEEEEEGGGGEGEVKKNYEDGLGWFSQVILHDTFINSYQQPDKFFDLLNYYYEMFQSLDEFYFGGDEKKLVEMKEDLKASFENIYEIIKSYPGRKGSKFRIEKVPVSCKKKKSLRSRCWGIICCRCVWKRKRKKEERFVKLEANSDVSEEEGV